MDVKPVTERAERHIFLLMGQSNMEGCGKMIAGDDTVVDNVFAVSESDGCLEWTPAKHPLGNQEFGMGLSFAETYLQSHPGISVGLIMGAMSGFQISRLNRGSEAYDGLLQKARFAMKTGTIKGILWHQGESDAHDRARANSYSEKLPHLVTDIREDLNNPELPFIAGDLGSFFGYNLSAPHNLDDWRRRIEQVRTVLSQLPETVKATAFVSSAGLEDTGDKTHFNRDALIELGKRYAAAFEELAEKSN
jgi:hypothetical protein